MRHGVVLSPAFTARINAAAALRAAAETRVSVADRLREAAGALDEASSSCDYAVIGSTYAAFAELVRCCAMLVQWRAALLNAEPDSNRFLASVRERCKLFHKEYGTAGLPTALLAQADRLEAVSSADQVAEACRGLAAVPLPVPYFNAETRPVWPGLGIRQEQERPEPEQLSVAFLSFEINGALANDTHFLPPQVAHDLELKVRVSRWPEAATSLCLSPVSVEAADSYEFPRFVFQKPAGAPPYVLRQRGRAVLKVPQSLNARPFEFKYTAEFNPVSSEQPLAVVGQRTLRIESIDLARQPMSGYPGVDSKILSLRNHIRAQNTIPDGDLTSLLTLMVAFGNLAAQAIHDHLYRGEWTEANFQADLKRDLRRRPEIASGLDEAPRVGGGITDLSFRGIRIELKSVPDRLMSMADCEQYVDQTVAYVAGSGKRLGLLCVLDCSPKSTPPFPAEDGINVFIRHQDRGSGVFIAVILIQGNLALPSALSR